MLVSLACDFKQMESAILTPESNILCGCNKEYWWRFSEFPLQFWKEKKAHYILSPVRCPRNLSAWILINEHFSSSNTNQLENALSRDSYDFGQRFYCIILEGRITTFVLCRTMLSQIQKPSASVSGMFYAQS